MRRRYAEMRGISQAESPLGSGSPQQGGTAHHRKADKDMACSSQEEVLGLWGPTHHDFDEGASGQELLETHGLLKEGICPARTCGLPHRRVIGSRRNGNTTNGRASPRFRALSEGGACGLLRPITRRPRTFRGTLGAPGGARPRRRTAARFCNPSLRMRSALAGAPLHGQRPRGYSRITTIGGPRRSVLGGKACIPYFLAWGALSSAAAVVSVVRTKKVAYR
jgi:hypothetical protein